MSHPHTTSPVVLEHHHTLWDELLCHFPYAIFSVVLSMIFCSLMLFSTADLKAYSRLFHLLHYLHLVFSATGVVLTYRRFSKSIVGATIAAFIIPAVFCTLSDILCPYVGGQYIGLPVKLHWCFFSHFDTVLPFLLAGIINGFVMSAHSTTRQVFYSTGSHFVHILVSSMASILFLVSFGFTGWHGHLAFIFLLLIAAVLLPCTLSDIVVPMIFARRQTRRAQQGSGVDCCQKKMSQAGVEQCEVGHADEKNKS